MNKTIEELEKEYSMPCLVYYTIPNPDYGKECTMDDIEQPTEEYFSYICDDLMSLGRKIPEYEDFANAYVKQELEDKITSSQCHLNLDKLAVSSLKDIETFYERKKSEGVRFVDENLNKLFGVEKKQ